MYTKRIPHHSEIAAAVGILARKSTDDLFYELGKGTEPKARIVPRARVAPWARPAVTARSRRRLRGRRKYRRYAKALPDLICAKWDYCRKRKRYETVSELVTTLTPVIAGAVGIGWLVAALTLMIFVRSAGGHLDRLCKCRK